MATDDKVAAAQISAQQRLAVSRRALVRQMYGPDFRIDAIEDDSLVEKPAQALRSPPAVARARKPRQAPRWMPVWMPVVRQTAERWWSRHPANAASQLARPLVARLARRKPAQLMLGSAAAGALVVLVRPWRLLPLGVLLGLLLKTSSVAGLITSLYPAALHSGKDRS